MKMFNWSLFKAIFKLENKVASQVEKAVNKIHEDIFYHLMLA